MLHTQQKIIIFLVFLYCPVQIYKHPLIKIHLLEIQNKDINFVFWKIKHDEVCLYLKQE